MAQEVGAVSTTPFPIRLSSFVGRAEELRDVREALDRHRLVTLIGPGGGGKTRLAVEAARGSVGGHRWYVDIAPVDGDGAVDLALAVATGAPEGPGEDPLDAAARRIGEATGLILVDNCDQVVDGCAKALDLLLRTCPGLTVLATGREPLRVEGEHVLRVPPLSLPDDSDDLVGDAVSLFLDRAQLPPEGVLRDRAGIREICERLDGMPLAIELAAARAASLSVSDVAAGLDDRFRLLADGPRSADRRQRSLAASIQWSYRLLSEAESVVLQRLAVFRSPFTAEAATAVVAGHPVAEPDVIALLARLLEKSFVAVDERDNVSRYRLLETIREYAAERLEADASDAAATRDRHLRYLRDSAVRMEPVFRRQPRLEWIDRVEVELPDIRAAVSWAAQTGKADDALRLVGSLSRFWWVRARADGGGIIGRALAVEGGDPRWRTHALTAATRAALARYDPAAVELGREAVRWAADCGDSSVAAQAHCWFGWTNLYMDPANARPHLDRAVELARDADDPWALATALNGLAGTELGRSLPEAEAIADEALALASTHDDRVEMASAHLWLALVALAQGKLIDVEAHARRALPLAEEMGDLIYAVGAQHFLAHGAVLRDEVDAAVANGETLRTMAVATANPMWQGIAAADLALASLARGEVEGQAQATLQAALPAISWFPRGMFAAWASEILTDLALETGEPDRARSFAVMASEFAEDADNLWARARAHLASARIHAHEGELHTASDDLHLTLELAAANDDLLNTVDALDLLAWLSLQRRAPVDAARLASAAAAARTRTGYLRPLAGEVLTKTLIGDLRAHLTESAFEQAWSQGAELSLDDAVALARRGRGGRKRPATGWDSLTPAELRVVSLVGEGLTNPQIATRLFVTTDTIKGHVSAALRKLGAANRAELAAEAVRREAAAANP